MLRTSLIATVCAAALTATSAFAQSSAPQSGAPQDTAPQKQDMAPQNQDTAPQNQDTAPPSMESDKSSAAMQTGPVFLTQQAPGDTLTESYAGSEIMIREGDRLESVGEISHLIVDDEQKNIGAVAEIGGFLGLGSKSVAINWSHLERVNVEEGTAFVLSGVTPEQLDEAPEYKMMPKDPPAAGAGGTAPTPPTMAPQPKSTTE